MKKIELYFSINQCFPNMKMVNIVFRKNYISRLNFITFVFCAMFLITILHFCEIYPNVYYDHIPKWSIHSELYRHVDPTTRLSVAVPDCNYNDILYSNKTEQISNKEVEFRRESIINGSFTPKHCNPLFSVAVLVPYRNRTKHLNIFVPYIHNFMMRQKIHYKIYLIEQKDEYPWNKGIMYNIGAKQAMKDNFSCLILHDVDLLPLDYSNLYVCTNQPRHMSARIDAMRFILPHADFIGGAVAIRADQFVKVNGFSNKFDDWGGEDTEFYERVTEMGFKVTRYPQDMSRYLVQHHLMNNRNPWIRAILEENRGMNRREGLDGVYHWVEKVYIKNLPLYTLVEVHRNWVLAAASRYKRNSCACHKIALLSSIIISLSCK